MSGDLTIDAAAQLREFELRVHMRVAPRERLAIAGPSGAGKTSVLRLAAGLLKPTSGTVAYGGHVWADAERGVFVAPELRGCGLVFSEYALFGHLCAWRNVAYGMDGPRRTRRARAVSMLERFGIESLAAALPGELSSGERQRVALARALGARPRVLLLDEPLSALDPTTRRGALSELRSVLDDAEVPVVVVTHNFEEAAALAGRVAVLERGRVVQSDTPAELSRRPRSAFGAELVGASVLHGTAHPDAAGALVELAGGAHVGAAVPASGPVAIGVFPWDVLLEPGGLAESASSRNRVAASVTSLIRVGDRIRVGLAVPEPMSCEITPDRAANLGIAPGRSVTASWDREATLVVSCTR